MLCPLESPALFARQGLSQCGPVQGGFQWDGGSCIDTSIRVIDSENRDDVLLFTTCNKHQNRCRSLAQARALKAGGGLSSLLCHCSCTSFSLWLHLLTPSASCHPALLCCPWGNHSSSAQVCTVRLPPRQHYLAPCALNLQRDTEHEHTNTDVTAPLFLAGKIISKMWFSCKRLRRAWGTPASEATPELL